MEPNPFLKDMPWVTIVTQVRQVGVDLVETPQSDCVRIWGRVFTSEDSTKDSQTLSARVFPHNDGLDRQLRFAVTVGIPDPDPPSGSLPPSGSSITTVIVGLDFDTMSGTFTTSAATTSAAMPYIYIT